MLTDLKNYTHEKESQMSKQLEQIYGQVVRTPNENIAFVVGEVNGKIRLLHEDGSFSYESFDKLTFDVPYTKGNIEKTFARFEKLMVLLSGESLQKAILLSKAVRPGLVPKKVTVDGKYGSYQKTVWVSESDQVGESLSSVEKAQVEKVLGARGYDGKPTMREWLEDISKKEIKLEAEKVTDYDALKKITKNYEKAKNDRFKPTSEFSSFKNIKEDYENAKKIYENAIENKPTKILYSVSYQKGDRVQDTVLNKIQYEYLKHLTNNNKNTLEKAVRPGLVPKKITVLGKNGSFQRTVWVRPQSELGGKEKKVSSSNKWYEKLKPSDEEMAKIHGKDVNALVNYVQDRFWKGAETKSQTIKTPSGFKQIVQTKVTGSYTEPGTLAYAFVKSNVDGYEIDDLIQEATIKLMELQDKGSMTNVSKEKFPSFVATIFGNVGRNMSRKNNTKAMEEAVDGFMEQIKAVEKDSESTSSQNLEVVKHKIDSIYSAVIKEIKSSKNKTFQEKGVTILNKYLAGKKSKDIAKEVGTTDNAIKQVLKRMNVSISRIADNLGVKAENPAKLFKQSYAQLNRTPSLAKSFTLKMFGDGKYSLNKLPEPRPVTEEIEWNGMLITIENPTGSIRSGEDWWTFMDYPYGYIQNTIGMDGEEVDVFVGANLQSKEVYIVTIKDPFTGDVDEEKVFIGFNNSEEVMETFYNHYDDPDFFHSIEYMNVDTFKETYIHSDEDFQSLRKAHGKQERLYKADGSKGAPIGTINTRKDGTRWKKVSDRKWEMIPKEGGGKGKEEGDEDKGKGKDGGGSVLGSLPKKSQKMVVEAVKGLANIIGSAMRGDSATEVGKDIASEGEKQTKIIGEKDTSIPK